MNSNRKSCYIKFVVASLFIFTGHFGMYTFGWTVSGVVNNKAGEPLPDVSVSVKNSTGYSTTTNVLGQFSLKSKVSVLYKKYEHQSSVYSALIIRNNLLVKFFQDGPVKLSLLNNRGRTLWKGETVVSQRKAQVPLPSGLQPGIAFLHIRYEGGVKYLKLSLGHQAPPPAGQKLSLSKSAVSLPTLLFKKSGYHDTSFTLTSEDMSDISVVMGPYEKVCELPIKLNWVDQGILVAPKPDNDHPIVSVKDATIQRYKGKYLLYSTVYNPKPKNGATRGWSMQFIQFTDFSKAASATPVFMDRIPGFSGYKCAPELVYFKPQKLWYFIWQQQDPAYSTTTTPDDPKSWSPPKTFYKGSMPNRPKLPIDYYLIRDDDNCYLFFTGDDGKVYRAKTSVSNFPNGFSAPEAVISLSKNLIFEGSSHYKVKGTKNTYLHLVEGLGSSRYFNAWTSQGIEGEWKEYKVGQNNPFASTKNVTYAPGVKDWTDDVSHGELIRENPSMYQEVDPCNFQFIYQGKSPKSSGNYGLLPYRLGLLIAQ